MKMEINETKQGTRKECGVMAAVYPTSHNKIWSSSGCVPLYIMARLKCYINLTISSRCLGDNSKLGEVYFL